MYAVRWESPDGRKGYTPKSEREWNAYNAAKPEDRQRVDRETRKYLPLTDDVMRAHLKGEIVIGIYPLLRDETCWFLAADFDKATWEVRLSCFPGDLPRMEGPGLIGKIKIRQGWPHLDLL